MKKFVKISIRFLPILIGGILGYAYYYFIGCRTGSCPIQGNPYLSTMYGALLGAIFIIPGKKKKDAKSTES